MAAEGPVRDLGMDSKRNVVERTLDVADSIKGRNFESNPVLTKTIAKSEDAISSLMDECMDMVMNVQVASDMREINRREKENKLSEIRTHFIETEKKKADERIENINSKWDFIAQLNDSIDIHNAYNSQKDSYLELIRQRDNVISALQSELEEADRKYVHDQNLHREDIIILASRINEHRNIMREAYRKHLKIIENTAIEEQKSELHRKHAEWENQNNIFEQEKVEDMNEIFKAVEAFEKETIDIIWDHSERHRSMKKNLETQLQAHQIKLKEIKAYCMLEERKLEYNYLVLTKRQEELGPIKSRQKRQLNRFHDELTNLENEEKEIRETHQKNCTRLEMEISKLVSDKEALIQKMKRSDDVNEHLFSRTWRLNEKRIRRTLDLIIKMDQKISEQILHLKWIPPNLKFKSVSELPSIQFYTERVTDPEHQNPDLNDGFTFIFARRNYPQLSPDFHLLKFILYNVINNMRFVVKDEIDFLTEDLDDEKKTLVKFDNILKVCYTYITQILDIKNEVELESLKNHFLPYIKCRTCVGKIGTLPSVVQSRRDPFSPLSTHRASSGNVYKKRLTTITRRPSSTPSHSSQPQKTVSTFPKFCHNSDHQWAMDQSLVVKVLANFLQDKKQRERAKKYSKFIKIPIVQVLTPADMELYWTSFKPVYVEELNRLWDLLYVPLNEHLQRLKEGQEIENEIRSLEKQNLELRRALNPLLKKDCKLKEAS